MQLINSTLLNEVTKQAQDSPRLRMNYNFHDSLDARAQRLLNALEPGTILPIHRHPHTAETYLLLAEASINLGDTQTAADAINVVRERSGASKINAGQATIDFLLDERIRELVGEELRRFTLVRTGKLLERTKKYNTVSGPKMDEHHALWPIPQSIIDSNTGAEYPQNPGYSK